MSTIDGGHHVFIWFDPGAAATGWAFAVVKRMAFSRPENKVLGSNLLWWESGEYTGHEHEHCRQGSWLVRKTTEDHGYLAVEAGTEDFDLVQTIGGKNLLSPVRINAVLDWECRKVGLSLRYQNRSLRTNQTRDRLHQFGFRKKFKKDEFAAMQHLIYRIRKVKEDSKSKPWKLNEGDVINAYWDCNCIDGLKCNLRHPK